MFHQKLVDSGLFAARMVTVTGPLVDRYNRCLVSLGFEPTQLSTFRIDSYGWSPEIALEKSNNAYLSHGDANPFAIIVSPDQAGLPVFYPYHNFDRKMMSYVYEDYKSQIEEITKSTAIIIDIDRYVEFIESPTDLLQYHKITVKPNILGDLDEGKKEQEHLIAEFNDGKHCLSTRVHQKLIANIKKYGDLRNKNLIMEPQTYPVTSFYTRMFGGVFILRAEGLKPILVCMNEDMTNDLPKGDFHAYYVKDPRLVKQLIQRNYITPLTDEKVYKRMETWEYVRTIANAKNKAHTVQNIMDNVGLFTKYLHENKSDLQRYLSFKQKNAAKSDLVAGYSSNKDLPAAQYQLIWKLLTFIQYNDIFLLYKWNKEEFYSEFANFSDDLQDWVVEYVVEQNTEYYADESNESA